MHMRAEARLQRSCPITTRQLESLIRLAQVGREGGEGGRKSHEELSQTVVPSSLPPLPFSTSHTGPRQGRERK
jgi:hypothetical protein